MLEAGRAAAFLRQGTKAESQSPKNLHDEVAVSFVVAGLLLLCTAYSILVYYRIVSIVKGIEPCGWIRSRNFFHPKAAVFDRQNRLIS
jgi:hypothetical protein